MVKKLVVYELRKFLRKLYEGYPTHFFFGYEQGSELEAGINTLLKDKIIESFSIEEEGIVRYGYRLLPEGLKLVESWNVERLTYIIIILTLLNTLFLINQIFL